MFTSSCLGTPDVKLQDFHLRHLTYILTPCHASLMFHLCVSVKNSGLFQIVEAIAKFDFSCFPVCSENDTMFQFLRIEHSLSARRRSCVKKVGVQQGVWSLQSATQSINQSINQLLLFVNMQKLHHKQTSRIVAPLHASKISWKVHVGFPWVLISFYEIRLQSVKKCQRYFAMWLSRWYRGTPELSMTYKVRKLMLGRGEAK